MVRVNEMVFLFSCIWIKLQQTFFESIKLIVLIYGVAVTFWVRLGFGDKYQWKFFAIIFVPDDL